MEVDLKINKDHFKPDVLSISYEAIHLKDIYHLADKHSSYTLCDGYEADF